MKSALPVVVAVLMPCALWANAGGYHYGGVESSGSVGGFEPKHLQAVRILDEQLTVDLREDGAEVKVRYIMRNETDRKVKVRFGFPIEESVGRQLITHPPTIEPVPDIPKSAAGYRAAARGRPLKAKFVAEKRGATVASDPDFRLMAGRFGTGKSSVFGGDWSFQGIVGWMVSEVAFGPGEEMPLAITFSQPFVAEYWGAGDTYRAAKIFSYRLSTAAAWAGTIARGRIELRPKNIDPAEVKVLKPAGRFERVGANLVWSFENLEPTLADDLVVEAVPDGTTEISAWFDEKSGRVVERETGLRAEVEQRGGRWFAWHRGFRASASSERAPYVAANVGNDDDDGKFKVWAEGAPGVGTGESLELRPNVARPLTAIVISPGYAESDALFSANARPKTVRVELNGEHSFAAQIPDSRTKCRLAITGYKKPVKSVKLVFEDVWKGSQHEDLCVSDVQLEVGLPSEPKLYGPE